MGATLGRSRAAPLPRPYTRPRAAGPAVLGPRRGSPPPAAGRARRATGHGSPRSTRATWALRSPPGPPAAPTSPSPTPTAPSWYPQCPFKAAHRPRLPRLRPHPGAARRCSPGTPAGPSTTTPSWRWRWCVGLVWFGVSRVRERRGRPPLALKHPTAWAVAVRRGGRGVLGGAEPRVGPVPLARLRRLRRLSPRRPLSRGGAARSCSARTSRRRCRRPRRMRSSLPPPSRSLAGTPSAIIPVRAPPCGR